MGNEPAAWLHRLKRYLRGRATVNAWRNFGKDIRSHENRLLKCLEIYPDSVLVAGCQRSGTTMLARLITGSDGMINYYFGADDEHDAALMLSGRVAKPQDGRYCFQTTYLNESYQEYMENNTSFKLIWVVRNPYSVVHSLLHNWKRFALNELFEACGVADLSPSARWRYKLFGKSSLSSLERACYGYAGKTRQALELAEILPEDKFRVIDYDQLVASKEVLLPELYTFIDLPYQSFYASQIHARSLEKANSLTKRERTLIETLCVPVYDKVLALSIHTAVVVPQ